MNIRDEELLYKYFERHMSNAEEQNFLIDVAARDDMRMAFRSQLELLKAVRRDKDALPGAAAVRERTLSAIGFAGVVLPAALAEDEAVAAPVAIQTGWRAFLHKPLAMISGGLLVGSIATYSVMNTTQHEPALPATTVSAPAPQTEIHIPIPQEPAVQAVQPVQDRTSATRKTVKRQIEKPAEVSDKTDGTIPVIDKSKPASVTIRQPKIVKPNK